MCQQTQVTTVLPYYARWMERFPTVENLAEATEADVLPYWQGLGYYRRCKLMLKCASYVVENGWPTSAAEIKMLPGIGAYTAGAIASICFNRQAALVDGNVKRVYARLENDAAAGGELNRNAWGWADAIMPLEDPGDWNQALMELGSSICKPRNPDCPSCPLRSACKACAAGTQELVPTKKLRMKPIDLQIDVAIHVSGGKTFVEPIPEGEWSSGLWQFPTGPSDSSQLVGETNHTITKHRLQIKVHVSETRPAKLRAVTYDELRKLGMPNSQWKALRVAEKVVRAKGFLMDDRES